MAHMTRKLDLGPRDRVLEIGTGSGYQAAILGSLGDRVYTVEIVPELARRASAVLREQGFRNVAVRQADGYTGWPEEAPFDAIIVTAGAARIPSGLFAQLRPGARMILPFGPNWAEQRMTLVRKRHDGRAEIRSCGWVAFVPFVGEAQSREPGAPAVWGRRLSPRCNGPLGMRFQAVQRCAPRSAISTLRNRRRRRRGSGRDHRFPDRLGPALRCSPFRSVLGVRQMRRSSPRHRGRIQSTGTRTHRAMASGQCISRAGRGCSAFSPRGAPRPKRPMTCSRICS